MRQACRRIVSLFDNPDRVRGFSVEADGMLPDVSQPATATAAMSNAASAIGTSGFRNLLSGVLDDRFVLRARLDPRLNPRHA